MASRLIDKLIAAPMLNEAHRAELLSTTVVISDNVSQYVDTFFKTPTTLWEVLDKLPAIKSPFKKMFIEWKNLHSGDLLGTLVERFDRDGDFCDIDFILFVADDTPVGTMGTVQYTIDSQDGLITEDSKFTPNCEFAHEEDDNYEGMQDLMFLCMPALWTLAFMNCKNAILEPVEPNAQENKRRAKHGKLPLMRYHVLKIKPFGARSDTEGQGRTHASPALHIRRGHFATYTDAAPLFGKYVGTYWKDQMLVGRKSNRVVVKDYEMDLTGAK